LLSKDEARSAKDWQQYRQTCRSYCSQGDARGQVCFKLGPALKEGANND
jgi:hypothetical protein